MALKFLFNQAGDLATAYTASGTDSGYNRLYTIGGARNNLWGYTATDAYLRYDANTYTDHLVFTRADLFAGSNADELKVFKDTGSGDTEVLTSSAATVLAGLVGPYSQDYVVSWTRATAQKWKLHLYLNASGLMATSSVFFADSFEIGKDPQRLVRWEKAEGFRTPYQGFIPHAVESKITMQFRNVTNAKAALLRDDQDQVLLRWPFFLYDSAADIIPHKLEHVIVADPPNERRVGANQWNIEISFYRLKHYR